MQCPRQLDSVGCGYYVQKYIHEIVHNSSTPITSLVSFYFHFLYVTTYDLNSFVPHLSLVCSSIQKMYIGKRRLTRFEQNRQDLLANLCKLLHVFLVK